MSLFTLMAVAFAYWSESNGHTWPQTDQEETPWRNLQFHQLAEDFFILDVMEGI